MGILSIKSARKWWLWAGAASLLLFSGCLMLSDNGPAIGEPPGIQQFALSEVHLNVLESGDTQSTPVVLIHGTPGNAGFFSSYLSDPGLQDLHLLSVDRPGWGDSEVLSEFDGQLSSQSAMLGEWLCQIADEAPDKKLAIVAHSYGATLTPRLIMDNPSCISAALLLAGAADPALAAPRWYNRMTNVPPVSWLASITGLGLKRSNDEMMLVQSGLQEVRNRWSEINLPITIIQGEEDMLVHPDHADFLESNLSHIPANVIRRTDDGHMVVHSDRQFVISELRKLLDTL